MCLNTMCSLLCFNMFVLIFFPARMEFRPLIEMTPDQLEPQVEMELNQKRESPSEEEDSMGANTTSRVLQRVVRTRCKQTGLCV